ncbi:MAG TPA: TIGR03619 family F420-dependent LLM class oxidoreductase [Mycobacteriales bacterium]|nr:TIGR03619 family F420-dependent LLM class oxidoreductase [Mycobacteriales bacterium]
MTDAEVTLSLGLPNFGDWLGRDWQQLLGLARAADEAGVDRLVVTDHVLMGRKTDAYVWGRFPTAPEAPWLEPLTCLTAIASVTTTVRLATGIVIAPLRPAPVLAKTVATLDVLSGGRLDLGVGVGWQREEYDAGGLDFTSRGRLLDDTIGACRSLWSQLPASYTSSTVSFADVFCSPQPLQPRLPVWFSGTFTARTRRRVLELGDGWIPIMGATLDDIRAGADDLRGATDRRLSVQAPVPPVRGEGGLDLAATMEGVPDLIAAGVTNVYLNAMSVAPAPAAVADRLPGLVDAFRAVTT